jgi:hypothetical protein
VIRVTGGPLEVPVLPGLEERARDLLRFLSGELPVGVKPVAGAFPPRDAITAAMATMTAATTAATIIMDFRGLPRRPFLDGPDVVGRYGTVVKSGAYRGSDERGLPLAPVSIQPVSNCRRFCDGFMTAACRPPIHAVKD